MDKNVENWVLIRKDGKRQTLMPGMMFVGREECDIILQSASADKRHAVIFFDPSNKEIHIKDLNSLTGTYVNGIRIPEQSYIKLKHSDSLRFGYGPDIFHIQKYDSSDVNHLINISKAAQSTEVSLRKPENIQNCTKNSHHLFSDVSQDARNKRSSKLHEADSLEDLRQESPCESMLQAPSPAFSSLTYRKSSCPNSIERAIKSLPTSPTKPEIDFACTSSNAMQTASTTEPVLKKVSNKDDLKLESNAIVSDSTENKPTDESETETSPLALAFTVAFDTPTPKKRFNIRDSISKYAPRKPEIERVPSRPKQEKQSELDAKKVVSSETKKEQVELRKKKPKEKTPKISTNQQNVDNSDDCHKIVEPKLSNGAAFLLQKMFRNSKTPSPVEQLPPTEIFDNSAIQNSFHSDVQLYKSQPEKPKEPTNNDDNKSDTGTYTIGEEQNDKIVQEERRKIDEVFGLNSLPQNFEKDLLNLSKNTASEQQANEPEKSYEKGSVTASEGVSYCKNNETVNVPTRPKRRLPTPPVQANSLGHNSDSMSEKSNITNFSALGIKSRPQTIYPLQKHEIVNKAQLNVHGKKITVTDQEPQSNRILGNRKLTMNSLELLQHYTGGSKSGNNFVNQTLPSPQAKTPPSVYWRRTPWNLSGSDIELDQLRVETSSVLSDVSASTEPTSCHVRGSKTETAPQMKFNRAFALRRARLGLETDIPGVKTSASPKDSQAKSSKVNNLTPVSSPLSRQDGGRFSLRVPKSSAKPFVGKSVTKPAENKTPVTNSSAVKSGHRRVDSDPSKTGFLRKGSDSRTLAPEAERYKSSPYQQAFHRASSFTENENDMPRMKYGRQQNIVNKPNVHSDIFKKAARESYIQKRNPAENNIHDSENSAAAIQKERSELSALDRFVISTVHQLSVKLKTSAHHLLEKERDKFTEDSSERLMIDEVLPKVIEDNTGSGASDGTVSRDLSNILKNLKRVEQSLKVLTIVVDDDRMDPRRFQNHSLSATEESYFVVDV